MARQRGLLPLIGTLEGINFYYRKGVAVARKAGGGFNGKAIKNSASMVRVRENNREFGDCSTFKKQFRCALQPLYQGYAETTLHGRMMQMLQALKNYDTQSERGQRQVWNGLQTTEGKSLFKTFPFTMGTTVTERLGGTFTYSPLDTTLTITALKGKRVHFPPAATHVAILFGVLQYDDVARTFQWYGSLPQRLHKDFEETSCVLTLTTPPNPNNPQLHFVSLQYYQELNGQMYVLKSQSDSSVSCIEVIL